MPKQLLEDMVRVKKVKPKTRKEPKPEEVEIFTKQIEIREHHTKKNRSTYFLWFIAFCSVLVCFFAISFLFAKADVVINPKIKDVVLNENLSANKDSNSNGLFFNLVAVDGVETKTIEASGEKSVSTSATGSIVLYNSFSFSPQTLNVDTKLEGSNGKIYKIQKKIIIPGMNKNGVPGQIGVGIYANTAGPDYNSGPLDFKVLGFKGTSKYSKFKGRSKAGTTITGGFTGKVPDISLADKTIAISEMRNNMKTDFLKKATYPDGFILYKDAVFLKTDDSNIVSVYNADKSATLKLSGTLYGIILKEKDITKKIAQDNVDKYDGSDVYIPNIKDLTFSLPNKDTISFADIQNITFNLSGPTKIVWKVDLDKFTADLLGKSKKDFSQILSQYSNIDSATLTITPIWKMSIPDSLKDVNVTVNYPK